MSETPHTEEAQTEVNTVEALSEGDTVTLSNMEMNTTGNVVDMQSDTWGTDGLMAYIDCENGDTVTLTNHGQDNPLVSAGITSNIGGSVTVTLE
jgi:hypothetical protein